MLAPDTWVALGAVARPHGVRGELRVTPYNRDSTLLLQVDEVLVRLPDGEEHEVSVDGARMGSGALLLKLHSVDDRDRAADLRGAVLCARRSDFPVPAPGEFYVCDIEGARVVVDEGAGDVRELGRVVEVRAYPSVDTLLVDAKDGGTPWEAPLVDSVVKSVDVGANLVVLSTMRGVERT
jgi:16S rRNA processing protein RimM